VTALVVAALVWPVVVVLLGGGLGRALRRADTLQGARAATARRASRTPAAALLRTPRPSLLPAQDDVSLAS